MRVLELHAVGSCDRFPGYTKVFLTFEELLTIVEHPAQNRDWHAALAAVKGIYLVTNTSDGTALHWKGLGCTRLSRSMVQLRRDWRALWQRCTSPERFRRPCLRPRA